MGKLSGIIDLGLSVDLSVDGGYLLTGSTGTVGNGDKTLAIFG